MKRALFVGVGTIAGLTATLRYTPEVPSLASDANLALGTSPQTSVEQSQTPQTKVTPTVPKISPTASKSAAKPSPTHTTTPTPQPTKSQVTPKVTKTPTPTPTKKSTPTSTPTPTVKPTHTPSATPTVDSVHKYSGAGAWASGYGIVQVQITVSGGKMTAITPLSWPVGGKSSMISGYAIPLLEQEALKIQSSNVSTVGGATYTSAAFRSSLASAMANAGL